MTDTNAPADIPSAPAPVNEVPINQNPPSTPGVVTNTPPEKTDGRPISRREAIQAAFDRATKQQDAGEKGSKAVRAAPKAPAADAKAGHNRPPEPTEHEGIDLKKRPSDVPRSERGQFAKRSQTPSDEEEGSVQTKGTVGTDEKSSSHTLPEDAAYRDPPPRMAEHAKREWATAPESVRGEVHRMHAEFEQAYNQLKPAADAFQPIAHFHQMARQHGTTLDRALHNYVSMEQKLRSDPVGGLDVIVNNLGLRSSDGQPIGLRDIAYHVLSQSPDQLKQLQMGNQQMAASHQLEATNQRLERLENEQRQMHAQQQFAYTRSQVDQFADSHPRFDELGTLIQRELELGFDLESAYRRAELLAPATHAAQTGKTSPAAQTRAPADRSISGSPGGVTGSNPAPRRNEKPVGRREAIANAIKRVNGAA